MLTILCNVISLGFYIATCTVLIPLFFFRFSHVMRKLVHLQLTVIMSFSLMFNFQYSYSSSGSKLKTHAATRRFTGKPQTQRTTRACAARSVQKEANLLWYVEAQWIMGHHYTASLVEPAVHTQITTTLIPAKRVPSALQEKDV